MTENLKIQKKKQRVAQDVPMIQVRSKIKKEKPLNRYQKKHVK